LLSKSNLILFYFLERMEAVEVVEQELEGAEPQNTIRELGHRR
jgi:hypothetical protein